MAISPIFPVHNLGLDFVSQSVLWAMVKVVYPCLIIYLVEEDMSRLLRQHYLDRGHWRTRLLGNGPSEVCIIAGDVFLYLAQRMTHGSSRPTGEWALAIYLGI